MKNYLNLKNRMVIIFFSFLFLSSLAYGQTRKICGTVINETTQKPLAGISVCLKNTKVCVNTNRKGNYCIDVPVSTSTISFSDFEGMKTKKVEVINDSTYNIILVDYNEVDIFDLTLEELMNVEVVTASKTKQSLSETPVTMMIVTEQMIKNRGYHHLEEILHDLPGFNFNKNYGVNYSTIFMRGYRSANSDRFLLMFDGILENDIYKQTTWITRQYPVSQIKQIEILYGPASSLYGTNAFSGIVNVITKKGDEIGDVNIVTTAGTWGRKNLEFASGQKINNKISYNITAKYFAQDDIHSWDEWDIINGSESNFSQDYLNKIGTEQLIYVDGNILKEEFNQAHPSQNMGLHANIKLGNLLFTALNWMSKEQEAYFYNPFRRGAPNSQWYEGNQGYMLSHSKDINNKLNLSSKLSYRKHKVLDSKESSQSYYNLPLTDETHVDYAHSQSIIPGDPTTFQIKPKQIIIDEDTNYVTGIVKYYNLKTWDFTFEEQLTYNFSNKINFVGGIKYSYTDTQESYNAGQTISEMSSSPRHIKRTMAGYVQAIIKPVKNFGLTIGGRYEEQKDEKNLGYNIFVPRFSAIYNLNNKLIFRFQYAEAFQEADDWHKFSVALSRPYNSADLEPEKLKAFEFGTTLKSGNNFLLSGTGYYTIISNFIEGVDNTPENPYHGYEYGEHYENISGGEVFIYGYEFNLNYKISHDFLFNCNISGALNYGPGEKMEKQADGNYAVVLDFEGEPIEDDKILIGDMSPFSFNAGLLYKYNNKFSIYPKVNFVGTKKTINWRSNIENPTDREVDASAIIGLNINIIDLFGLANGLDINIKFDNLLNSEYYNPGSRTADGVKYPSKVLQPGFNFMIGLKYSISN